MAKAPERADTAKEIVNDKSFCFKCGKEVTTYDDVVDFRHVRKCMICHKTIVIGRHIEYVEGEKGHYISTPRRLPVASGTPARQKQKLLRNTEKDGIVSTSTLQIIDCTDTKKDKGSQWQ